MKNLKAAALESRLRWAAGSESFRCLASSSRRKMQPYQLAGRQECGVFLSVYLLTVPINDLSRASELTVNRGTTLGEPHFILEPIRTYGVQPAQGKRGHEFGPIRLAIFRQLHPFASVICGD
jgi:hypothetical protein